MLFGLANLLFLMRGSLRGIDSPRQLAAGVVLGMLVGLVPKDSLLVVALVFLLILSNANLVTGLISALVFSSVGCFFDLLTHNIGVSILTYRPLQPYLLEITQWPLVGWMRIENTVVSGSVILGLFLLLPVYQLSYLVFSRYQKRLVEFVTQSRPVRWILGYPSAKLQES